MEKNALYQKIREVSQTIFSYCVARTSSQQDAEDLSQDILAEIIRSAPNLRDDHAFYAFMWSVAGNVWKQWCRKKHQRKECSLPEEFPCADADPLGALEADEDIFLLRREMSFLSHKYRCAAVLYYLEGKPCTEIANVLSLSESMVKYLLFKARKILKEGMEMVRNYGEQSYHPKQLTLMYMGEGPNHFSDQINSSQIRQNIVWSCYNDSLTEEQIALQIGISLPYIESDIQKLTEMELLQKNGNRYSTNIILVSDTCKEEISKEISPLQEALAQSLYENLLEREDAVRSIGFYGSEMSRNTYLWQMACIVLATAFERFQERTVASPQKLPLTAFEEHALIWGEESYTGGFNICSIDSHDGLDGAHIQFMDWVSKSKGHHMDFYGKIWISRLYTRLARGLLPQQNEYEQELIADLVRKGYVIQDGTKLRVTVPVYTSKEFEKLLDVLRPVIDNVGGYFKPIVAVLERVLREHAPIHLKKQIRPIACMQLFESAVYAPVSLLCYNGWLSTDWDAAGTNEMPTTYIVLAD